MTHYSWWYKFAFLFIEALQALIGIATLTLWRPCLTVYFAVWTNKRRRRKAMKASYGF